MKVVLAQPRGFCAGVERAVKIVELALEIYGRPVYVRREIVHNSHVVQRLREMGAIFVSEADDVPNGAHVVFSAHGVSPTVFEEAERRGLHVIDATCPLVAKVHMEVDRFVRHGYHIVLIGHAGHDEVVGTIGHAPSSITLVQDVDEARRVELPPHERLMVLTQTTLGIDDTADTLAALRERFPHLELPPSDDICYATQNRQNAVKAMSERGAAAVLVVGSRNSSNAQRLVEVAAARGVRGYLIDSEHDVRPEWLDGVAAVGVTAGASTPEDVVRRVLDRLRALGATEIEVLETVREDTVFSLPPGLRQVPLNISVGSATPGD
ncbi:MAG: 4-hydroxy-3-methylbut-2-enyl diphosphate reductase [Phycisphaerae bacterium]|nr:4-hydroxy-3-methylbut-2-enyl diphosphate reductase [Phycisphaerae bacterium]